jgi:hypothetical protein
METGIAQGLLGEYVSAPRTEPGEAAGAPRDQARFVTEMFDVAPDHRSLRHSIASTVDHLLETDANTITHVETHE